MGGGPGDGGVHQAARHQAGGEDLARAQGGPATLVRPDLRPTRLKARLAHEGSAGVNDGTPRNLTGWCFDI